jgi:cell division protein FtsB
MDEEILNFKKKYLEYHKLQQYLSTEISDLEENIDDLQEDYNQTLIRESKFL